MSFQRKNHDLGLMLPKPAEARSKTGLDLFDSVYAKN
jgi:hypothetical protein